MTVHPSTTSVLTGTPNLVLSSPVKKRPTLPTSEALQKAGARPKAHLCSIREARCDAPVAA